MSTWGKKVGRRWDQIKRSDSIEFLDSASKKKQWTPSKVPAPVANAVPARSRRVSRVESLRNLFTRGNSNISLYQLQRNDDKVKSSGKNGTDWVKDKCQEGISDLYEMEETLHKNIKIKHDEKNDKFKCRRRILSESLRENPLEQQCLIEYLLQYRSLSELSTSNQEAENKLKTLSYDDLFAAFKELSQIDSPKIPISEPALNKKPPTKVNHQSKINTKRRHTAYDFANVVSKLRSKELLPAPLKSGNAASTNDLECSVDKLYTLLNNFLILKAEESGYESDSTRNGGGDSPRGSIKSNLSNEMKLTAQNTSANGFCKSVLPDVLPRGTASEDSHNLRPKSDPRAPFSRQRNIKITPCRKDKMVSPIQKNYCNSKEDTRRNSHTPERPPLNCQTSLNCGSYQPIYGGFDEQPKYQQCVQKTDFPIGSAEREFKCMRFSKHKSETLGIYIEKKDPLVRSSSYVISFIEPGSIIDR